MRLNREISTLHILHGLLTLTLPFVVLLLTSCLEADESPQPFGPEIQSNNINSALSAPFANMNPTSIQQNEFVHFETNQQVVGGTRLVTRDTGITVIERTEDDEVINLTLAIEEFEYDGDGNSEHTITEDSLTIAKASSTSLTALAKPMITQFAEKNSTVRALNESASVSICEPTTHPQVTFHNLVTETVSENVPSNVLSSDFCASSNNCKIQKSKISFDQVFWDGDEGTKIHCEYAYSSDVPFLAGQMRFCMTLVVPAGQASVLLTECQEVLNFQEGS